MTTAREPGINPLFQGRRVALMRMAADKRFFGVAMHGGRHVVQLPLGYDGLTMVHWVEGWIIVQHPELPPLLADTGTGKHSPMNEHAVAAAKRAYVPMLRHHGTPELVVAKEA